MKKKVLSLIFVLIVLSASFVRAFDVVTNASSGAYVYEDSNFIYLGNDFLEIQFSKNDKGAIHSFLNKLAGHDYRTNKECSNIAWELHLTIPTKRSSVDCINQKAFGNFIYSWARIDSGFKLYMIYGGSSYKFNVTTSIIIFQNSSLTRWRLNVENAEENWAIELVRFPVTTGFMQLGASGEDDYLMLPEATLLKDPYKNFVLAGKAVYTSGIYPCAWTSVQLMLLGDQAGGLYWATYDINGNAKSFEAFVQSGSIYLTTNHYNVLVAGQNYAMEYDTVLGVFRGSIDQALSTYRDWGTKQSWVENGVISKRIDLPDWLSDGFTVVEIMAYASYFNSSGAPYPPIRFMSFGELSSAVDDFSYMVQSPILLRLTGWEKYGPWVGPDYFPPVEGFDVLEQAISDLHAKGHKVILGLSAGLWDTHFESYDTTGKYYTMWDKDNNPIFYTVYLGGGFRRVAIMSLACPQWQEIVLNSTLRLVQMGVDGIELDALFHEPVDFSPYYDHPVGGGSWYTQSVQEFFGRLKHEARILNKDFVLATEGISEPFIPYVDLYMCDDYNIRQGVYGLSSSWSYGTEFEIAPLFSRVYSEYILAFGREMQGYANTMRMLTDSPLFLGHSMAFGLTNNIVPELGEWLPTLPPTQKIAHEIGFACHAFRPLIISTALQFSFIVSSPSLNFGDITIPSVFSSAWISDEENIGYLLINIGNTSFSAVIEVDFSVYGLKNEGDYSVFLASSHSFEFIYSENAPLPFSLNISIAPESVVLIGVCKRNESILFKTRWETAVLSYGYSSILPKARGRGIPTEASADLFRKARKEGASGNYQESLTYASAGLLNMVSILGHFSFLLNDTQSFQNLVNEAKTLDQEGRYFEAATKAFQACEMALESLVLPIFFDNLHTDEWRLKEIFPKFFGYDRFKSYFESIGYKIVMIKKLPLSWDELAGTKAAIIWVPTFGTMDEVDSILRYISEGNNLILMLDGWMPREINQLTMHFGVEIFLGAVVAKEFLWDEGSFAVNNFTKHPVTEGISYTDANWIAPMKTTGNASALAYTSNDTWTSENPTLVGPFVYMAASTYGSGKVLVIADNLLVEEGIEHLTMLRNAMSWFLGDYWRHYLPHIAGDVNGDGIVDIFDVVLAALAFDSRPGDSNWNQAADLDNDDVVDIFDIVLLANNFGKVPSVS